MQERALLDLALSRTKELGVGIAYNREKKKFFYDGAAFAAYLKAAPRGPHAAAAEFALLSYQFYQSTGTDAAATIAAADAKKKFLARYPSFAEIAEVRLYLAVDYRDLSRKYGDANDAANAEKYRRLARAECQRIVRLYPRSEQAGAARQMLQRLNP
jgi:outer membrane protein assembly factor BamD (BamD/ComL family)